MDPPIVLLLETDAVARHALAEYLRECGYRVIEATNTDEALQYFESGDAAVNAALLDVLAAGSRDVFALAQWLRAERPQTHVVLVGALETSAKKAALCETGPSLSKPFDHAQVVDMIRRFEPSGNERAELAVRRQPKPLNLPGAPPRRAAMRRRSRWTTPAHRLSANLILASILPQQ